MAPENVEHDAGAPTPSGSAVTPPQASAAEPETSSFSILRFDGRLLELERDSRSYATHLVKFQDALIAQIWTVGVLELVFALFLAVTVWSQYRSKVVGRGAE